MASSRIVFVAAVTVGFLFFITVHVPRTGGSIEERSSELGSRPPVCVNKCLSCRPCKPTLVVPTHQKRAIKVISHGDDDAYYLLSWKCRCGNKLFQP